MKFFDKLTKLTDKIVASVEETAKDVSETYNKKGLNGFIDRANTNFDNLAKSTQEYYNKLAEDNKKITKANTSNKIEDKIATAAAVVVNTTQTVVDDVVKATVNTAKNVVDTNSKVATKNEQEPTVKDGTKSQEEFKDITAGNVAKNPKAPVYKTFEQLTEAEFVSLNSTPLEIVLDNMGATADPRMPGKFKTDGGGSVMLTSNKWYSFSSGLGSEGAVSLVKFALTQEAAIKLDNPKEDNMLLNEAVGMLQAVQAEPTYQVELSAWMKKQKAATVTTIDSTTPVVKTVKPKAKKVVAKVEETVAEVKPVAKRTRKATPVVVEAPVVEEAAPKRTRKNKM